MKLLTAIRLLYKKFFSPKESEFSSFTLAEKLCSYIYPKYIFSDFGRIWLEDRAFFSYYERFEGRVNYHSADRKFFLKNLLKLVHGLPGDTAECGAYKGASSYLICEHIQGSGKTHHIFDSFAGLSEPVFVDGNYWHENDLKTDEIILQENLSCYSCFRIYKGWIPDQFPQVSHVDFCFVHIDVDLYQPTLDSLAFFYPRMVKGGIILCDDYGSTWCPGAKRAFDEYMCDKSEQIVHVPTGQGFIIK